MRTSPWAEVADRRRFGWLPWIVCAVLLTAGAPALRAETATAPRAAVKLGTGSELWIEGTSTIHDWHSKTSTLGFALRRDEAQVDPADPAAIDAWLRSGGLRGLDLVVPLATMRSGKGALDKNMLKALRAETYPEIRFALTASQLGTARGDTLPVTAEGELTVSGETRPVRVQGRLIRQAGGVLLEGTHAMKMTDHKVQPPKLMMGTLKVRDPITVFFRLLLVPGTADATTATH
jgi:hypothetical protein